VNNNTYKSVTEISKSKIFFVYVNIFQSVIESSNYEFIGEISITLRIPRIPCIHPFPEVSLQKEKNTRCLGKVFENFWKILENLVPLIEKLCFLYTFLAQCVLLIDDGNKRITFYKPKIHNKRMLLYCFYLFFFLQQGIRDTGYRIRDRKLFWKFFWIYFPNF